MRTPELSIQCDGRVQLVAQQLGHPPLDAVHVRAGGSHIGASTLEIRFDPAVAEPRRISLAPLAAGEERTIPAAQLGVHLSASALFDASERIMGQVRVRLLSLDDRELASAHYPIEVLPADHWPGNAFGPETLAAFVVPNASGTATLLDRAKSVLEATGRDTALEGYQSHDPRRVLELASAVYGGVAASAITYASPPASFAQHGQRVRLPDRMIAEGLGTCLDLSVGMAAALEQIGLHPLVVLVEGHAFPGVWLVDEHPMTPVIHDAAALRKRCELGELALFDSSPATKAEPFGHATERARAMLEEAALREAPFRFAVNVKACRGPGVHPLPTAREELRAREERTQDLRAARIGADIPTLPERSTWLPDAYLNESSRDRLKRWKDRLLDLSTRNRLVDMKDGGLVLPLAAGDPGAFEDALFSRESMALAPNVARVAGSEGASSDAGGAAAARGTLLVNLTESAFESRAVKTFREVRNAREESGHCPLYLCLGALEWYEDDRSDRTRRAPILLVPITMQRDSVRGPYRVRPQDDEPVINPTLLRKLEVDFGINTAGLERLEADDSGVDVALALQNVRRAVVDLPRFDVVNTAAIAVLRFTRALLYNDLNTNLAALQANPVVHRILDPAAPALENATPLTAAQDVERGRPAQEDLCVDNADSSQQAAVFSAVDGNSFVLQGPPGTGKSQTILNLVANFLGRGKSVLFVAEKRAALEVVARRLERVGLGPFVLEAHSDKRDMRAEIIRQFEEPLRLDWPAPDGGWQAHAEHLARLRAELAAHVDRMHAPGPFGESLFQAMSAVVGGPQLPDLHLQVPVEPSRATYDEAVGAARSLARAVRPVEPSATHPFAGLDPAAWTPGTQKQLEQMLERFDAQLESAGLAWSELEQQLGLTAGAVGARPGARLAHELLAAGPVPAALLRTPSDRIQSRVESVLATLQERRAHAEIAEAALLPSVYTEPGLPEWRSAVERWATAFFLFAFLFLFSTRSKLKVHAAGGQLPGSRELGAPLQAAEAVVRLDASLQQEAQELRSWFGDAWRGGLTDAGAVQRLATAAVSIRSVLAAADVPTGVRERVFAWAEAPSEYLSPGSDRGQLVRRLSEADSALKAQVSDLERLLRPLHEGTIPTEPGPARQWARRVREHARGFRDWVDFRAAVRGAESRGLAGAVEALADGAVAPSHLEAAVERALRKQWVDHRFEVEPALAQFRGTKHEELIEDFRKADTLAFTIAREHIQATCAAKLPDPSAPGAMEVIRREVRKRRGHKPLRKLFSELRDVIQRLKPCVLMSPLSVARYLDPKMPPFDVVVFDEASQIPPWDAVGALARAKQAIIVGDSKQLPPTNFFMRSAESDDDEQEVEELESILDHCIASGFPEQTLDWHYRSRHESLIAFSNERYYLNRLLIFPSPLRAHPSLGLRWVEVPDGFYDRSASRTNQREAQVVVEHIVEHFTNPESRDRSLGVVTFSMAQRDLIENLLDEARRRHPEVDATLSRLDETVFVRNLESVQGDERDVIYFSVGYAPDRGGRLRMNFGPLNNDGGERRLNVAITRSREKMLVFSTLRPDQIDLSRTNARGVRDLKLFLQYAARGSRALAEEALANPRAEHDSPFEAEVAARLEARGWAVHAQVGVAGYRVDLAVVNPDAPGTYLLGVECDGAQYHSSATARDRDRIRQSVLENLGWRIHRIWSTDWWIEPERQLDDLDTLLRRVRATAASASPPPVPANARPTSARVLPPERELLEPGERERPWPPEAAPWPGMPTLVRRSKDTFLDPMASAKIASDIRAVVDRCAPLTQDALAKHIATVWGFKSLGSRIRERVSSLIAQGGGRLHGTYVWPQGVDPGSWRGFRYSTEAADREFDEVPDRELKNAARWVVTWAPGIRRDDACREMGQIFGVGRRTKRVQERLRATMDELIREGALVEKGEALSVGPGN